MQVGTQKQQWGRRICYRDFEVINRCLPKQGGEHNREEQQDAPAVTRARVRGIGVALIPKQFGGGLAFFNNLAL